MKPLDRFLQRWRIAKAGPYIGNGTRVLDVGCSDGTLFRQLGSRIGEGVGIDPDLREPVELPGLHLLPGKFPEGLGNHGPFDVITMLAVLEHIPPEHQQELARGCSQYLKPGGYLVITTPSPLVDRILDVLAFVRLIDGMSLEQHYGFEPGDTPAIFSGHGISLVEARKFQLGLNHLFVFRKDGEPSQP